MNTHAETKKKSCWEEEGKGGGLLISISIIIDLYTAFLSG